MSAELAETGRAWAIAGAVVLFGSLYLTWYTLSFSDTSVDQTSYANLKTAADWFSNLDWFLGVQAVSVLVFVVGSSARGASRHLVRLQRSGAEFWCGLAVVLIIWRIFVRPGYPGVEVLKPSLSYGPFVALLGALAMTYGVYLFVRAVPGPPGSKFCPECAERVHEDAKVCKHCGHRWQSPTPDSANG